MTTQFRIATAALTLFAGATVFAQGDYGADPDQCKMNISLYQDAMSRNDYAEAYGPWRRILDLCPKWSKGAYQNGTRIMNGLIAKEKDPARKQRLVDSLYMIHDMRIEHFGEEAFVLGRKGLEMMTHEPDKCKEIFEVLKRSVDLGGARSEAGTLSGYFQALSCMHSKGEATKEQLLSDYVIINDHLEKNLARPDLKPDDVEYVTNSRDRVNGLFFKVAECQDIGRIAEQMIKAHPDDAELKVRLLKVLNGKDCSDEKIYRSLAEDVHRANPSSESGYSLGMMLVRQNEMSGALRYMKEAVDLCKDCPDKLKYLLKAGQVASAAGNHAQSRAFANQILQLDPKSGEAYMLIGNAVASQGGVCEGPQQWGVYWLAYDYYQRAKANDPAVAEKANDRMAASQGRFPTSGEAFFHQLADGQSFAVNCGGLNESTTVRTRK
jgi:tetratricopeptide (TPR) repeat protein